MAARSNHSPDEVAYDYLAGGAERFLFYPIVGYNEDNLDVIHTMLSDETTILGLSDGGAHCSSIVDASVPSWMLIHWARDRSRGPKLPLEMLVKRQTDDTARFFGFHDRGLLKEGMKADVNVIDYERLRLHIPEVRYDLPMNGRRLVQRVDGYKHTFVSGVSTFEDGQLHRRDRGPSGSRALIRSFVMARPPPDAGPALPETSVADPDRRMARSSRAMTRRRESLDWKSASSANRRCTSIRSPSAATSSAGPPMRRCRSSCSTRSSPPGFNFIDSADVYSRWHPGNKGGESETIIGNWLQARGGRDKVIIATKLGIEMAPGKKGLSRKYMMQAVEDSLRRLQTDYIDLYQSHRDDPDTPIEETLSAYADLIKQGKVREIGASNFSAPRLADRSRSARQGLPRYQSLQPHYSLVERAEFEGPLEELCLKEKIGVIGYYSLASGFLTGKYRSAADAEGRARGGRVAKYLNDYGFGVIAALDDVAKRYNAKPVQVAMAWLMARPSVTAPIASATNLEQLAELLKSAEIKLDAAAIEQIDAASKPR